MINLDMRGQACPIPVVKAMKALEGLPAEGGSIEVVVDNDAASKNLSKMASGKGCSFTVEQQSEKHYVVRITKGAGDPAAAEEPVRKKAVLQKEGQGLVVAIGKDSMGQGSEELGKILVKGFLFSLTQLNPVPKAVLFFNSGVFLTLQDANTIEDLRTLEEQGTKILICGTCVDYYKCQEQVAVGEITNMYGIVEMLDSAASVINL